MALLYDFEIKTIDGENQSLKDYEGKAVLIVNVASKCGLTPQYKELQSLYEKYQSKEFFILGLPCNQFLFQEPKSESEIKEFCSLKYNVTFPMASKVKVNGKEKHPLYEWLTGDAAKFPGKISWNFEKFLISKTGEVLNRFDPKTKPDDPKVIEAVENAIA